MKIMPKIFYAVFVILVTVILYNSSDKLKFQKFYETEAKLAIENDDYDKYFEVFFTATKITDKYNTIPIYEGVVEDKFNLKIMQTITNNTILNWFYLSDSIEDYSEFLDEDDHYLLEQHFTRLMYTIKVYMGEDEYPITNYFYINPNAKDARQPLPLMQFHINDEDELTYYYSSNDKDDKVSYKESKTISKIELFFTLDNSTIDEPINTKIIEINHDQESDNSLDNLMLIESVYTSNNFNGFIDNHDTRGDFKFNETFIKTINYDDVNTYSYVKRNYMLKAFGIIFLITYLIFFLAPTINFIREKMYKRKLNAK